MRSQQATSTSSSRPTTPTSKPFQLTAKQREANRLLAGPQRHTMLYGGSRSGKTFLLCRAIAVRAMRAPGSRHAIGRFRFNHCKTSIGFDTFPKMMGLAFPGVPFRLDRTDWFFEVAGSQIWLLGLDEKDRVEKILGQEYSTIYLNECSQIKKYDAVETIMSRLAQKTALRNRAYYDCNPPGTGHWTHRLFVEKVKPASRKDALPSPENFQSMILNPADNAENLDADYLRSCGEMSEKKRKRFELGLFLSDYDNALWAEDDIDLTRVSAGSLPDMQRIVVGVDPSGAKGDEDARSDEIGIVVCGRGVDGKFYIIDDLSLRAHPSEWGAVAARAYHNHKADLIVAENNFGGEMVVQTIRGADKSVNVKSVNAGARGKVVRAEPVAALWKKEKACMVGSDMQDLEDQMTDMTTAGYMGERSPDRLDAMVWAMTELSQGTEFQFFWG